MGCLVHVMSGILNIHEPLIACEFVHILGMFTGLS